MFNHCHISLSILILKERGSVLLHAKEIQGEQQKQGSFREQMGAAKKRINFPQQPLCKWLQAPAWKPWRVGKKGANILRPWEVWQNNMTMGETEQRREVGRGLVWWLDHIFWGWRNVEQPTGLKRNELSWIENSLTLAVDV